MPITTDIITITYGDLKDFDRLKKSIEEHCSDYNLIVWDNNKENIGYTRASNAAMALGSAPYIWHLNQDAVVLEGAQEALIKRLESHPKSGMAGSMQIDYDNRDLIRHCGTSRAFPGGVHKGGYISMGHGRIPEKQTWVNYASVMLKRALYEDVGPMDESMHLVYSDSDYCYMARSKGWDVWYEPGSRVLHKLNASKKVTEWHEKDMIAFMKKWDIQPLSNNTFSCGKEFQRLDKFP